MKLYAIDLPATTPTLKWALTTLACGLLHASNCRRRHGFILLGMERQEHTRVAYFTQSVPMDRFGGNMQSAGL